MQMKQKDRKTGITYVYEVEYYWDREKKQSRRKLCKCIGKLGPTEEIIPTRGRRSKDRNSNSSVKVRTPVLMDMDQILIRLLSKSVSEIERDAESNEKAPSYSNTIYQYRTLSKRPTVKMLNTLGIRCQTVDLERIQKRVNEENDSVITSNGKKIFNLLLLNVTNAPLHMLQSSKEKNPEYYDYIFSKKRKGRVKAINYLPGRSVSFKQLCEFGMKTQGFNKKGVKAGLMNLISKGLVVFTKNEKKTEKDSLSNTDNISECELIKLSVPGCKEFLKRKKGKNQ